MKFLSFLVGPVLMTSFSLLAQTFEKEIVKQDSLLFEVGFNQCRLEAFDKVVSADFEFYHDLGGITKGKAAFIESIAKGICSENRKKTAKRKRLEHMIFPLNKEGKLYGVLQQGRHQFNETDAQGRESEGSSALFSHLWLLEEGEWKLSRSYSFDHRLNENTVAQRLDAHLVEAQIQNRFNGAVLVAKGGKILLEKGYGFQDFESKRPHSPASVFAIYSITKTFTAQLILQLVEEKKLLLDEPLSQWFPSLRHAQKMTIRHLLSHTSGLFNYTDGYADRAFSEPEMVKLLNTKPLNFEPGTQFAYCNSGYSLLGFLAEKIEKQPFGELLETRFFKPLGMKNSGFDFKNLRHPEKSKPYAWISQGSATETELLAKEVPYSGGAIYSTVQDLYRYHRGLSDRQLLGSNLQLLAYTPVRENYGFGWMKNDMQGTTMVWHNGGAMGFRSVLLRNEALDLCIVMLANSETDLGKLSEEVLAITLGKPLAVRPVVPISAEKLETFSGAYQDSSGMLLRLVLKDRQLFLKAPGSPPSILNYEGNDAFFDPVAEVPLRFASQRNGLFDSVYAITRRGTLQLHRVTLRFGLVGSATANGWNGPDQMLTQTASEKWEQKAVKLTAGELKIRANQSWTLNFGGELNQTWAENGPNCKVEAGTYDITWDERDLKLTLKKVN